MQWIKDIVQGVVSLIQMVPIKARIAYVGLIIILGFGLLYYIEMHDFKLQMAQIESAQPQQSNTEKLITERTPVTRIYPKDEKQVASMGVK